MIKQSCCMLILLLISIAFIQSCPPYQKRKDSNKKTPKHSTNDENPSRSGTVTPPTTIVPDVFRRKEIMLASIKGHRLDECSYIEKRVGSVMECAHLCLHGNGKCQSINIEKERSNGGYKCQLNHSTKQIHAQKFVKNAAYNYLEPKMAWVNGNPVSFQDIAGN